MQSGSPPSAGIYDFLGWLETNKKQVAIGVGVLVFAAIVFGIFVWRGGQREVEAEEALSTVRIPFSPGEVPAPGAAESYEKIAGEYSGTKAAPKALLRAGTVYFDQGNYAKAQENFEKLLRNHGDTLWVPQAVFGIAASLEAQNKLPEAITRYGDFVRNYPADPAGDLARLSLARLYEQTKQTALAVDVLKKMTEGQGTPTPGMQEAQEKLRELFNKHPEMIPAPPAPPAPRPTMLTNIVLPQTNVLSFTNLIRRTNTLAVPTGGPPNILLNPGNTNAGK